MRLHNKDSTVCCCERAVLWAVNWLWRVLVSSYPCFRVCAVETLKQADYIAAEDTRNTQKLLNHFDIHTKQISFHKFNTQERIPELIAMLKDGKNIAQVSDAGMPSISDPGHELVEACAAEGIRVIALPGPSASLTALIASGLVPQPFLFYGFLPRKKTEQVAVLEKLNSQTVTMIFYEAPHRLNKTLKNLMAVFGEERKIVLCTSFHFSNVTFMKNDST